MPQRLPMNLFNTGIGLKEGDPDPHWQLVARSDDPKFKPRPAVVTAVFPPAYRLNNPARSQWISTANMLAVPGGVYTFRTTFELADAAPESAVLAGRFLADNHVNAIRINGNAASVPEHGTTPPFDHFHSFLVRKGFVEGTNVLEIDVLNLATSSGKNTPMMLLVELEGFAFADGTVPAQSSRTRRRQTTERRPTDEWCIKPPTAVAAGAEPPAAPRGPKEKSRGQTAAWKWFLGEGEACLIESITCFSHLFSEESLR